jgi:hypothetical protein
MHERYYESMKPVKDSFLGVFQTLGRATPFLRRRKKMMHHMMNPMMPYGMMSGVPLLWIVIGFLLALLLVAAVTWLLARWRNGQRFSQTRDAPHSQDSFHMHEQGYQPAEPSPEAYQEGGRHYSYPPPYEQPAAQYPQEMPLQ